MPWSAEDASRFTKKARSKKSKSQFRDVANSALSRGASEGSAIRQANAVVKRGSGHGTIRPKRKSRRY